MKNRVDSCIMGIESLRQHYLMPCLDFHVSKKTKGNNITPYIFLISVINDFLSLAITANIC